MISRITAIGVALMAGSTMAACKTFPSGDMTPAALMSTDETSMTAVKTAAAEVLGRETVKLGASDLANSPAVSILPKRAVSPPPGGSQFSQQQFGIPTMLLLMTDGKNCFLVKEGTRELAHVAGVTCRSLG